MLLLGLLAVAVHAALAATAPWTESAGTFRALLACATVAAALPLARQRGRARPADGRDAGRGILPILAVAAVLHALWLPVRPSLSDDVYRYAFEGRLLGAGISPYAAAPADSSRSSFHDRDLYPRVGHPHLSTVYPPLSLAAFALGDRLGGVGGQKVVFALASLAAALFLGLWMRRRALDPAWLALFAWSPLPAIEFAGHAHHDALGLALLAAALWALSLPPPRGLLSAVAWSAAAASKGASLVTLPAFWRAWPGRARWAAAGGVVLGLAPLALLWGPQSGGTAYLFHWEHNGLLFGLLRPAVDDGVGLRVGLALLLVAGIAAIDRRRLPLERSALAASTLALFVSPTFHPWYGGWVLLWAVAARSAPAWLLAQLALFTYALPAAAATPGFAPVPMVYRLLLWGIPALLWAGVGWRRRSRAGASPPAGRPLQPDEPDRRQEPPGGTS